MSAGAVQVAPSNGLYQDPEVAAQLLFTVTAVPSRLSTCSRVLQEPVMVIQWGKNSNSTQLVVLAEPQQAVVRRVQDGRQTAWFPAGTETLLTCLREHQP